MPVAKVKSNIDTPPRRVARQLPARQRPRLWRTQRKKTHSLGPYSARGRVALGVYGAIKAAVSSGHMLRWPLLLG